jgi:exopolysaccharide production protein ExoY
MYRTDAATGAGLEVDSALADLELSHGPTTLQLAVKRLVDVVGAALILLIFLPLLCIVVAGVLISSGPPIIYSHRRVGFRGRKFNLYKFRSMRKNADEVLTAFLDSDPTAKTEWEEFRKLKADPRVTNFGAFLRRSSLDEFPQLWNVLRGEMSLVGPRPVTRSEMSKYGEHWATYCSMKPGISGLWQVNGRNGLTYQQRVAFDVEYVRNWSLGLDLNILLRTVSVVLRREGSM